MDESIYIASVVIDLIYRQYIGNVLRAVITKSDFNHSQTTLLKCLVYSIQIYNMRVFILDEREIKN